MFIGQFMSEYQSIKHNLILFQVNVHTYLFLLLFVLIAKQTHWTLCKKQIQYKVVKDDSDDGG